MSESPTLVTVRVKSRTGDIYVRAGRFFRPDAWQTIEVALDIARKLESDPWLDVRDLPQAECPVHGDMSPSASLEQALAEAHARVSALEDELRAARESHARELETSRETHAREIAAATQRGRSRQGSDASSPRPATRPNTD